MTNSVSIINGVRVLVCSPDGPAVRAEGDATDLVALAWEHEADWVALPVARLDERFFDLTTGLAGAVLPKFTGYRIRLAVVGDIADRLAGSESLSAFVREVDRGHDVWFVADLAGLEGRLAG